MSPVTDRFDTSSALFFVVVRLYASTGTDLSVGTLRAVTPHALRARVGVVMNRKRLYSTCMCTAEHARP